MHYTAGLHRPPDPEQQTNTKPIPHSVEQKTNTKPTPHSVKQQTNTEPTLHSMEQQTNTEQIPHSAFLLKGVEARESLVWESGSVGTSALPARCIEICLFW